MNFLDTLDSNKLKLKLLTYINAFSSDRAARPHEICYLDICYLIRHSSAYSFHFSKITKTARKNKIIHKINCNRINFTSSKNLCVYDHIHLYIKRT